ncbi:lipopolysaccharide heptosyltransferase II [Candidatus Profftia tarda]|uniref:lipopolysaccharide heptosyltransferase II n=1 Tax=Candidatus Profftia tarda TaxID=1177216 RepID=A0A8E4MEW4_9ENTR|nr:lipopolysaccharide heptosyltransferase II [Candidatus Profftia tarda]CAD6509569.1 ADP-heptose--LPS heptosyltransferase 2 [Candidatus Profftia tarda]
MKILIIGPSWVGDMIMSHSLYRTLKDQNTNTKIDVIAPDWCRSLLSRMPEVNKAIDIPLGHGTLALTKRYRLGKSLRDSGYDRAYILPHSFKSALVPFFARIPFRAGWKGEMRYGLLTHVYNYPQEKALPLMVERYIALAYPQQHIKLAKTLSKPLLLPKIRLSEQEIEETADIFNLKSNRSIIGLCPGAEFGLVKRWPHYHYASLSQKLIDQGYRIVLFGSAKDHPIGTEICNALTKNAREHCLNLVGQTNLEQVVALIAACDAIVTNDSGLMHVAAAVNKPLVALYGPTSPDFTPPLSPRAIVIRLITVSYKICQKDINQQYHHSLIDIKPNTVLRALQKLLTKDSQHSCTF